MTSQSLRKLRTTLRKTYSNKTTCQNLRNGLLGLAIFAGAAVAACAFAGDLAQAQSWQGRNSQARPAVKAPATVQSEGYVEPVSMPITMDQTKVQNAIFNQRPGEDCGVQLVNYSSSEVRPTVNNSLKWSSPAPKAQVYRAARQPQMVNAGNQGYVQQVSGEALSDPFGDRRSAPRRGAAYGTGVPTAPITMPVPGTAPEVETPPTLDGVVPNIPGELDPNSMSDPDVPELGNPPALDANAPSLDAGIPTAPEAPNLAPVDPDAGLAPNLDNLEAPAPTALEGDPNGASLSTELAPATETAPAVEPSRSTRNQAVRNPGSLNPVTDTFRAPGSVDDNLARARKMEEKCPPVSSLKPINKITNDITPAPGEFPNECTLGDEAFAGRNFAPIRYTWTAPNMCNNPLYFEDANLERYGHSWGPIMQPIMSAGHFVLTVPCLPWLMAIDPPNECVYTLGYYRPGNCAPYIFDPLPYSVRAAAVEGGVATALVFLIP